MRDNTMVWLKRSAIVTMIGLIGLIGQSCSSNSEGTGINGNTGNTGNLGNTGNTGTGGTNGAGLGGSTANSSGGFSSGNTTSTGAGGFRTSGGSTGNPGAACQGLPFEDGAGGEVEACAGIQYEAEAVPVDMFIIMDSSISMSKMVEGANITRWQALQGAVDEFVNHPDAQGVGAGIGFFPRLGYDEALDCDASWYTANPAAPIGLLSESGGDIVSAMETRIPDGLTPAGPALRGAIDYAREWATDHRGRATVVVFVSDGYPTMCEGGVLTLSSLLAAAKEGIEGSPPIRTFAIGLGAAQNLHNIARSGGTNQAYLVEFQNIATDFVAALLNITNSKVGCQFELPEPVGTNVQLDKDKVQFVYTPASGETEEVPRIESAAACARNPNGGWYYDNPANPSLISVCPCTCSRLQAGTIDLRLGCKPKIGLM